MRIQLYDNEMQLKKMIIADNMEVVNTLVFTNIFIFHGNGEPEKYRVNKDESFSVYDK